MRAQSECFSLKRSPLLERHRLLSSSGAFSLTPLGDKHRRQLSIPLLRENDIQKKLKRTLMRRWALTLAWLLAEVLATSRGT